MNGLSERMVDELGGFFRSLRARKDLRVVILSGTGANFCAGLDLKSDLQVLDKGPEAGMAFQEKFGEMILAMRKCPQPIIGELRGAAAGGGMAIALACDLRVAEPDFHMRTAFIKLGLGGAELGVSYLLPRLVGASIASQLMLTGRPMGAEEAKRLGLLLRVVSANTLRSSSLELADEMLEASPFGLRLTKEALELGWECGSLETAIALENRAQVMTFQSRQPSEGIRAFREKRKPEFPSELRASDDRV
jgi:enoyl-CoA hydratase/carnithine racemase